MVLFVIRVVHLKSYIVYVLHLFYEFGHTPYLFFGCILISESHV